jgi:hypothetical protein
MSDLAVELMRGCLKQFEEEANIEREAVIYKPNTVRFTLTKI